MATGSTAGSSSTKQTSRPRSRGSTNSIARRQQLANAATRARARQAEAFNRRNLDGFLASYSTAEARYEDRRKGLRDDAAGPGLTKRARALFEAPKRWRKEMEPVAIRGPRLALTRDRYRDTDSDRTITAEHLTLTEVGDDDLVHRTVLFDPDDINGAIGELTARWIASGEVAHPPQLRRYAGLSRKSTVMTGMHSPHSAPVRRTSITASCRVRASKRSPTTCHQSE